jgi:hypothetical protein
VDTLRYADLRASVYTRGFPAGLTDELPALYSSLYSTPRWFRLFEDVTATGACTLEEPRHVLFFSEDGDTVEVLNSFFTIAPSDVDRACTALFRALPRARRVHIEVTFPTSELRPPRRDLFSTDHLVIDLPTTAEEYTASLGKRTRGNLRNSQNRLRRDFSTFSTEIRPVGDDSRELVDRFVTWKTDRLSGHGRVNYWEDRPDLTATLIARLAQEGEVHTVTISGAIASLRFVFPVGDAVYAMLSAFDPRYEPYRLGFLSAYLMICDAVRHGFKSVNLQWGTPDYKLLLGAKPVTATRVSIFRSQRDRLYSLDEGWEVASRNLRRAAQREYWRARHAAGRLLKSPRSSD